MANVTEIHSFTCKPYICKPIKIVPRSRATKMALCVCVGWLAGWLGMGIMYIYKCMHGCYRIWELNFQIHMKLTIFIGRGS